LFIFGLHGLVCILLGKRFGTWPGLPVVRRLAEHRVRLRQALSLAVSLILVGVVVVAVLNAAYGFQGSFRPLADTLDVEEDYDKLPMSGTVPRPVYDVLLEIPCPLPTGFVQLVKFQASHTGGARGVYFAGKVYDPAPWYLMVASFAIKTPLPLLLLVSLSVTVWLLVGPRSEAEWLMVVFVSFIITLFSVLSDINVGIRYILPICPFLFVLASRLASLPFARSRAAAVVGLALCGWYLFGTLRMYPHYLAYMNELVGGPKNGYRYLVDSNLDWGQDLKLLKEYMDRKNLDRITLGYFGSADADYYGIGYDSLPSVGLDPKDSGLKWWHEDGAVPEPPKQPPSGLVAVSATLRAGPGWMKDSVRAYYWWARDLEPVDQIGYSILIYEIPESAEPRPG
jgi:hypothetical protein